MCRYFFVVLFILNSANYLLAQNVPVDTLKTDTLNTTTDTIVTITDQAGNVIPADSVETINTSSITKRYSPRKALFYAAILPGLGQVYNESYWKLPILYGTAATLIFAYNFNKEREIRFRRAYLASTDGDESTSNPFAERIGRDDPAVLQRNIDASRRNKEYMIILTGLLYLVNIVDAHVDAHLKGFDMADDIVLKVEPSFERAAMGSPVVGLALTLQFK